MSNSVSTTYSDPQWGKVVFFTDGESEDPYSVRVRTNWKPDPEVDLAISLINRGAGGDVVDLGANIGTWCLPTCLATKNRFLLFEALPANSRLLQMAINANNLRERAYLSQIAIWDVDTTLKFSGSSAYGVVDDKGSLSVLARSLDSLLDDGVISQPHLIKMDIEGCELRAINGGKKLLSKFRPDIIFEGNGAHCSANGYFPQDIIKQLESLGYSTYAITNNKLALATSNSFQPFGLVNYISTVNGINSLDNFETWSIPLHIVIDKVNVALHKMKPGYKKFMLNQYQSGRFEIPEEVKVILTRHINL